MTPAIDPAMAAVLTSAAKGDLTSLRMLIQRSDEMIALGGSGYVQAIHMREVFARLAAAIGEPDDWRVLANALMGSAFLAQSEGWLDCAEVLAAESMLIAKGLAERRLAQSPLHGASGMLGTGFAQSVPPLRPAGEVRCRTDVSATLH